MAEIHEVHEVDEVEVPVERRRRGLALPFLMFLLGGVIIAAVVVAVLNVQSTITWPAGQVSLGPNTAVATAGNTEALPPASVTGPTAVPPSASSDGDNEAAEGVAPPVTTPPAVTDQSTTPAPADTTATSPGDTTATPP